MELEQRIKNAIELGRTISEWAGDKNSEEFKEYNSLSILLKQGRLTNGCKNCAKDFYNYLVHLTKPKIKQMTNGKFEIGKDKNTGALRMIQDIKTGAILTDLNLTDENALKLLKSNKKWISAFQSFPEDWENQVDNFVATTAAEETQSTEQATEETATEETNAEGTQSTEQATEEKKPKSKGKNKGKK
jgi:hypothetical protein